MLQATYLAIQTAPAHHTKAIKVYRRIDKIAAFEQALRNERGNEAVDFIELICERDPRHEVSARGASHSDPKTMDLRVNEYTYDRELRIKGLTRFSMSTENAMLEPSSGPCSSCAASQVSRAKLRFLWTNSGNGCSTRSRILYAICALSRTRRVAGVEEPRPGLEMKPGGRDWSRGGVRGSSPAGITPSSSASSAGCCDS